MDSRQQLTRRMGYLVDSSSHYILGVGVPALVASTIVLYLNYALRGAPEEG